MAEGYNEGQGYQRTEDVGEVRIIDHLIENFKKEWIREQGSIKSQNKIRKVNTEA